MKLFIYRVLVFLLPVLTLLLVMELYIRSLPNEYTAKKEYMDMHAPQVETLILGNSHALNGINPAYMDGNAYNLAFAGQTLKYDWELLQYYGSSLTHLKNIIIPISYFSLYNNLESNSTNKFRLKYYKINFGILREENILYNLEMVSVKFPKNISTIQQHLRGISPDKDSSGKREEYLGWSTRNYTVDDIEKEGKEKAAKHERYIRPGELASNMHYLDNIISFAEQHKCKLYFITTPHYASYYRNMETDYFTRARHIMDSICSLPYSTPVRYIDMMKDSRFTKSDFVNSDHLSVSGAARLSSILNGLLREP